MSFSETKLKILVMKAQLLHYWNATSCHLKSSATSFSQHTISTQMTKSWSYNFRKVL